MHIEFLVEDSSGERLLHALLPMLVGNQGSPHTWRLHKYKGVGRIPKGLGKGVDSSKRILLDNLPKLLAGYGRTPGIDAVVVILDADRRDCRDFLNELIELHQRCNPATNTVFRLAIEEMEAWYFGDKSAILKAYPRAKKEVLGKYIQDSVCGTWEMLADAIYPGGFNAIKKAGWPAPGQIKHEWAEKIGPRMHPDVNVSPSFGKLRDGIRRLIEPAMSTARSHPQQLVIGTRGSALALTQADATEAALAAAFPGIELVRNIIQTTGDRRTDVSLASVAKVEGVFDKGVFIKEIEDALAAGEIDIAVHSLKDLPTVLDPRFELAAVLERAPVRDVWLARDPAHSLAEIPAGSRIGTSSVRRAREAAHHRPDLTTCDLRGNVPTRLRKLAAGEACDAAVLAEAGLVRLGLLPWQEPPAPVPTCQVPPAPVPEAIPNHPGLFAWRLAPDTFHPAAGQGAIGLEIRTGDEKARAACQAIRHETSWLRILAEREFLRLLDGGCHTPVGIFSTLENGELHLKARVFPEAAGAPRHAEARGSDPIATAAQLYQSLR